MKLTYKALALYIGVYTPLTGAWQMGRIYQPVPHRGIPDPIQLKLTDIIVKPKICADIKASLKDTNPGRLIINGKKADNDDRPLVAFQGVQIRQGDPRQNPLSTVRYIAFWVNKNCESVPQVIIHFWDEPGTLQDVNFLRLKPAVEAHGGKFDLANMSWWSWGEVQPLEDGAERFPWVPEGGHGVEVGRFESGLNPNNPLEQVWVSTDRGVGAGWGPGDQYEYVLPEFDNGLIAVPKESHNVRLVGGTEDEQRAKVEASNRSRDTVRYVQTGRYFRNSRRNQDIQLEAQEELNVANNDNNVPAEPGPQDSADVAGNENGGGASIDQILAPPAANAIVEAPSLIESLYALGAGRFLEQGDIARQQLENELQHLTEDQIYELQRDRVSSLPAIQLADLLFAARTMNQLIAAGYDSEERMSLLTQQLAELHTQRGAFLGGVAGYSGYEDTRTDIYADQIGTTDMYQSVGDTDQASKKEEEGQQTQAQVKVEEIPVVTEVKQEQL
ncbi:hypothetical protein TWF481_004194 [Arthrobotrys musiformis]|uniref:Uncharacterized protein n=1 Tax=Arthrobotrys musiformis TaxID=47236 RepID=A0AAV9WJ96_9PEZI